MDEDEIACVQRVCAEARAWELVVALSRAMNGAAHWRRDAARLLLAISVGDVPKPKEKPFYAEATAARGDGPTA